MLPPFSCCRKRDLPDPYQHFQPGSSTILPCHHRADGSLGWICPVGKYLHRPSSTRKPSGFLPGTPVSKLAQRPPDQQGPERCSCFSCTSILVGTVWMQPEPPLLSGHRSRTGSHSSIAATAESCRDCALTAEPWGSAQQALPVPQLVLSLKRTLIKKGKKKTPKIHGFCCFGFFFKQHALETEVQQYLRLNLWIQTSSKS